MAYGSVSPASTPAHPLVITKPSTTVAGGVLIAWCVIDDQNSWTFTLSGFTPLPGFPVALNSSGGTDGGGMWVGYKYTTSSEPSSYSLSNNGNKDMSGGMVFIANRDAASFLHRIAVGSSNAANNSPWPMNTGAYTGGATTGLCDLVVIGGSDNKPGGTVTHTEPSGFSKRADVSDGTFYQSFVATLDAVAAGDAGSKTASGAGSGLQAGWAICCIALLDDGTGGGSTVSGSASDALSAADAQAATATLVGARVETLTAADAPAATMVTAASATDALSASDAPAGTITTAATRTDALSGADTQGATVTTAGTVAETLAGAETQGATTVATAARGETLAATDAQDATVIAAGAAAVAESLSAADAASATATLGGSASDSLSVVDAPSAALVAPVARTDTLAATDAASATVVLSASITETLNATESTSATAAILAALDDILSLFDAQSATGGQSIRHLDEPLSITFTSLARAIDFDLRTRRIGFLDGGTTVYKLTITKGEIEPIEMVLQGADPDTGVLTPYDVSAATALTITVGKRGATAIMNAKALTKVNGGGDGRVSFTPSSGETDVGGNYEALVIATFSGSVVRKFPGELTIRDAIA